MANCSCEVGVIEQLPAGHSIIWIERDHLPEEVKLNLIHEFQRFGPIALLVRTLQLLQTARHEVVLDAALFDPHHIHDPPQLVQLALPLEQSVTSHHEMEDTPQCPYVHLSAVLLRPQKQLRSAVVQRPHHIRHGLLRKIQLLGHSQINDLEVVVVGINVCWFWLRLGVSLFGFEHDIGGFQVAVDEVQGVEFQCPLDGLAEQFLDGELFLAGDDPIQVCSEPLHDHHGLLLVHEGLDHPRHVLPAQDLVEISFSDETRRQSDLAQ